MKHGLAALALMLTSAAQALPMASVDSWMVMGDFASDAKEIAANYALTRNDALGFTLGRSEHDAAASSLARAATRGSPRHLIPGLAMRDIDIAGLSYTRLLQRWNLPHAQANLWFIGTVGTLKEAGHAGRTMARPVLMADFETTRVYASATLKTLRADGFRHDGGSLRAGFSLYEVEYDEIQPWLVLEVQREIEGQRLRLKSDTVTPMLRLIHRRWFVELGASRGSDRGDRRTTGRFNFMWTC
jgi:hypothetical protein